MLKKDLNNFIIKNPLFELIPSDGHSATEISKELLCRVSYAIKKILKIKESDSFYLLNIANYKSQCNVRFIYDGILLDIEIKKAEKNAFLIEIFKYENRGLELIYKIESPTSCLYLILKAYFCLIFLEKIKSELKAEIKFSILNFSNLKMALEGSYLVLTGLMDEKISFKISRELEFLQSFSSRLELKVYDKKHCFNLSGDSQKTAVPIADTIINEEICF